MMTALLAWPFFAPLLAGLCHALLLSILGCYLRLRGEWLAALALAQMSAAGALAALALAWPPLLGGALAAALVLLLKRVLARAAAKSAEGGSHQALLMLLGVGAALLISANTPASESLARTLFDGQLIFIAHADLIALLLALPLVLLALRLLSRRLLLWQCFADFARARGHSPHGVAWAFDALCALGLVLGAMQLGVFAAFALVFVPPLLAFTFARHWRQAIGVSIAIGTLAHLSAFALSLMLDQPYGAVLTLLLSLLALALGAVAQSRRGTRSETRLSNS